MKKSFYFALALTAGLFASCSSDDLSADAPRGGIDVNDNEAAQISINVGNPATFTRGTGSVAGTTWGGQTFNLFMFDRGTFTPSTYTSTEGGVQTVTEIYNNTLMTTKVGQTIANQVLDDGAIQYQYFPTEGRFSFWAYRVDDAAAETDANGKPVVKFTNDAGVEAASADEATQVRVPFEINGSQDLMIAETKTTEAAQELNAAEEDITSDEDAATYIYSAYAARRGVNPKMTFKHQLTRLMFKVKANTKDVSTMAPIPAGATPTEYVEGTTDYLRGFWVTKVEVWSKSTGALVAAYKGDEAPAERIVWDNAGDWPAYTQDANGTWQVPDASTNLVPFELKSREPNTENADIKMAKVRASKRGDVALADLTDANGDPISTTDYALKVTTIANDTKCYISPTLAAHGVLDPDNETTFSDAEAATLTYVYIPAIHVGYHNDDAHTSWEFAIEKPDPSLGLVSLKAVVPEWKGEPGWNEKPNVETYTWVAITEAAAKADPYNLDDAAVTALKTDAYNNRGTAATLPPTEKAAANSVKCFYDGGEYFFYGLPAANIDNDGATLYTGTSNPKDDAVAGTEGDLVYTGIPGVDAVYYEYKDAPEGEAVATPIGESLMVAPADQNGYLVRLTYCRSVLDKVYEDNPANNVYKNTVSTVTFPVKVKSTANAGTPYEGKFAPNKTYTVTVILYNDGRAKTDDGDLDDIADPANDRTEDLVNPTQKLG